MPSTSASSITPSSSHQVAQEGEEPDPYLDDLMEVGEPDMPPLEEDPPQPEASSLHPLHNTILT